MNCQEVMEYMQRELDGDLGEIESAKLLEHIRHCADCAAMYERLKRLSAELENLPKVTPPFSLVDAILPKLDEIDRANAAAAGADAGAAGPAGASGSVPANGALPRRRISRFNLRMLGGVVAAGIAAGIFLVTYNQDRLNGDLLNLGMESASSGSSAMSSSASSASSAKPMLTMDSSRILESADQSGPLLEKSLNFGSADDAAAGGQAADSASGGTAGQSLPTGDGVQEGAGPGDAPGSASAAPGAGEPRMSPPDLLQGSGDAVGVAEWEEAAPDRLGNEPMMSIAGFVDEPPAEPIESVSPDGAWIAAFEDSRLIIRDREGNTWFEGEERAGAVAALGWSDDGTHFRYELRREDGTSEVWRVDPVSGNETREDTETQAQP